VIPTTSVSRPQLKSNPQGDSVLRSNSHGKKLEVEEHQYQLADLFTKALAIERFQYLVRRLGMRCLTPAELEALANESA
nr:ribonuclease H-like domain-containing protein [Tanacetum cinerariifolium]